MIALPKYVQILSNGYKETYTGKIIRSEFDRGIAKQRSLSSNGIKQVTFNAIVCDENYQDFLSFYRNDLASGANWFEFIDPSKSPAIKKKARMISSDLVTEPTGEDFPYWGFTLTLEMYD
ncbi:MAG TPA: hypothetical protein PLO52_01435 [Flavobacterium alvei]|nr:hypothetical protein [Flavobacterium alvei]